MSFSAAGGYDPGGFLARGRKFAPAATAEYLGRIGDPGITKGWLYLHDQCVVAIGIWWGPGFLASTIQPYTCNRAFFYPRQTGAVE